MYLTFDSVPSASATSMALTSGATTVAADKTLYQSQIEATDQQIDELVYELYGLTEEEIAIVEGHS